MIANGVDVDIENVNDTEAVIEMVRHNNNT